MISTLCRDCLTHIKTEVEADEPCDTCGSMRLVRHAELEDLDIAHVDCDAFYASVEKRDDPSLRDKPLIVGHPGGRGVVTTACYIARKFGPRSAMPMFKAMEMCPDAVVVKPDMAKYKEVSQQIRAIFREATPIIEPVSLDEAYLDLSAETLGEGLSPAWHLARISRRIESDVGISVSIGLSYNRFLAKLASDMEKPRGFSIIPREGIREFLAPLPVRKINGVGDATANKMEADQIRTIGDLQALPEAQLVTRYGKFGNRLVQFVRGDGSRRITPLRPSKSISAENTFRRDTSSLQDLLAAIEPMCDTVARRLDRSKLAGGTVVVKLKTDQFQTLTRNRKLANPTQRANILYQSACQLIKKEANGRAFRLIGVGVADLCPAAEADPPDLFGGML